MDTVWVLKEAVLAIHDIQLAEHGGAAGVRDMGALESALARPLSLAAYGEPSIAELAASYGFGIARDHAFVDGNKRTALVVMEVIIERNGYTLTASNEDAVLTMLALAAGELTEDALADWLRRQIRPHSA